MLIIVLGGDISHICMTIYGISRQGGESVALGRLKYYLWDSDHVATYFETRNGMLGGDYSTKLAPWLAAGCISPKTVYHQVGWHMYLGPSGHNLTPHLRAGD